MNATLPLCLLALAGLLMWRAPRNASPPVTLAVAAALRLVMLGLTYRAQPYDFVHDFHQAGANVLAHRDPILNTRPTGWNYFPTYAFVLAAPVWIERHFHVPWLVVGRLVAIAFDLGLVALLTRLAGRRAGLRWACNPFAILVCAVHGQMEPACLFFALAAFATARNGRAATAGLLLGVAISVKSWPVLFLPALLQGLPGRRARIRFLAGTAGLLGGMFGTLPLTVGTPVAALPRVARVMLGYEPAAGGWGWFGVVLRFSHRSLPVWRDRWVLTIQHTGAFATLCAVAAAAWWWRRAHPLDTAHAVTTAFLVTTPAFGIQYLMWPMPFQTARPAPRSAALLAAAGLYGGLAYLAVVPLPAWWHLAASLVLVPLLVAALPWRRRTLPAEPASAAPGRLRVPEPEVGVAPL